MQTDRGTGMICDQRIALNGYYSAKAYSEQLRRIRFKDPESGKTLVFLTNNTALPASTIAALYKSRWQVELFFKWIKQHLRIKRFIGNSENAVKTQIWCAIATYVLIAIAKRSCKLMPRSTLCYRFCRSLYSRKLSYTKPSKASVTLSNTPTSITN
jgi:transposase